MTTTNKSRLLLFTLTLFLFSINAFSLTTRKWLGSGTELSGGTGGTDFNAAANWDGSGIPSSSDSCVVRLNLNTGSNVIVSLSSSITVGALYIEIVNASGNKDFFLDVGTYSLTINGGTTALVSENGNHHIYIYIGNNPGKITYGGDASFGNHTYGFYGNGGTSGQAIFKGNLTFNSGSATDPSNLISDVLFDGSGSQTLTNNSGGMIDLCSGSLQFGSTNSPTVSLAGSNTIQTRGNLTVNSGATLDLGSKTLNRNASG